MCGLKKGDFVIIGAAALAFAMSVILLIAFSGRGDRVIVKQDNKIIYNESLYTDKTVDTGTNTVVIKNGAVYMESASCKNQICVATGKISKKGETIVCLPNKVVVEIN